MRSGESAEHPIGFPFIPRSRLQPLPRHLIPLPFTERKYGIDAVRIVRMSQCNERTMAKSLISTPHLELRSSADPPHLRVEVILSYEVLMLDE